MFSLALQLNFSRRRKNGIGCWDHGMLVAQCCKMDGGSLLIRHGKWVKGDG
tara:strand:+ start:685 stop:837 length:153 start_codon:yes stop_codon:yes gene_type:complete